MVSHLGSLKMLQGEGLWRVVSLSLRSGWSRPPVTCFHVGVQSAISLICPTPLIFKDNKSKTKGAADLPQRVGSRGVLVCADR